MVSFIGFVFIYVVGGITFLPFIAIAAYIYSKGGLPTLKQKQPPFHRETYIYKDSDTVIMKKGWIRLTNQYQPKMPEVKNADSNSDSGIISGIQSYVSKDIGDQKKGVVYAVLKHGTLFCYGDEKQQQVEMILPMQDFSVTLYPTKTPESAEGSMYTRMSVVRLIPNALLAQFREEEKTSVCTALSEEDITSSPSRILYLTCARNIDKEDWYLGLLEASHMLIGDEKNPEEAQYVMMDNTHFDSFAIEDLIRQVQSSPSHRETAWINAVFGRLFLGMYKTERLKNFIEMKIRKKIDKTKRPTFLDEITVRKVDVGGSVPFITDPKLLSLSPEGEVIVEAKVEYSGGLTIEIETDFNWSYSSRLKPIRMHVILAVRLNRMAGRMMFKIKAPPTNRYWVSFFEMPEMEWKITPVVADKQIKLSIVTNAIESRIREVMADSFVLPNMDDTSFCPSQGKGGIFGEYIKVERRTSSESAYVNDDTVSDGHRSRENSTSSEKPTAKESIIRGSPSVPDHFEKPSAADVLKLKTRRAESAAEFAINGSTGTNNDLAAPPGHRKLEVSHSTPDIHVTPSPAMSTLSDNESIKSADQKSIAESTMTTNSTSSKWSSAASNLRKRLKKGVNGGDGEDGDDQSDTESTTAASSGKSKLLNKIHSLLPTDSNNNASDSLSIRSGNSVSSHNSGSSGGGKVNAFLQKAENFIQKKAGGGHQEHEDEHLSDEKKEAYAERLANMSKRAQEKRLSSGSLSSNHSIPPPPLPPLPTKSNASPVQQQWPELPASSSTKSLLDDDTPVYGDKALPPPIVPCRERAASSIHQQQMPPLPPRRNSTPTPPADDLVTNKTSVENTVPIQEKVSQEQQPTEAQKLVQAHQPTQMQQDPTPVKQPVQELSTLSVQAVVHEEVKQPAAAPPVIIKELSEEPIKVQMMPKLQAQQPPAIPNKPRPPLPAAPRPNSANIASPPPPPLSATTGNSDTKPPVPDVPRPAPPRYDEGNDPSSPSPPPAVPSRTFTTHSS